MRNRECPCWPPEAHLGYPHAQVLDQFVDRNWRSLVACDAAATSLSKQPSAAALKAALANRQSNRGVTPLMLACMHGHSAAARQLVALVSCQGPWQGAGSTELRAHLP